jgi:phage gp29-like protein
MVTEMATTNLLTDHLATRARSLDFAMLGLLLPNPDPILKAQGKDISVYRDLRTDALVGGCIRRRKSAVKALDWGLDRGQSASRVAKSVQGILDDLDLERIIGQMLEATLYGYQPMEITWQRVGGLVLPVDVQSKPPEWFCFDAEAKLRFKTRQAPLFGELLPERKFLLPRQDPTYQNPYGFADLSMCFWPTLFKKGGLKFWLAFTEKFGSAFSVGKLPRSATSEERATLLDSLEALIQNGVATIPDDGSIELIEAAGKAASADLYEKLVLHCRGEIAIALLGQNQTTEASANKASAGAGLEVTKDLRDGDAEIVAATFNQLIRWVCELNFGGAVAPVFSLWDQQDQDTLQAARDKSNYDAGARFTNAYWERAYGYQEGDLQPAASTAVATKLPGLPAAAGDSTSFADTTAASDTVDPTQLDTDALVNSSAPAWSAMARQIQGMVDQATSFAELQRSLVNAYGDLDTTDLVKLMSAAMALAELKGMDSARAEASAPAAFSEVASTLLEATPDPRIDQIAASVASLQTSVDSLAAKESFVIHNTIQVPEQAPPVINNTVQVPEQAPPTINMAAAQITVQPADVVVNNTHPSRAIQVVERDTATDEITRTVTTYED